MRISVKNDGLTRLDCEHSDKNTIGKISVDCKKKKISVFPSNTTYMRCQYENARKRAGYGVIISSFLFLVSLPCAALTNVQYDYSGGYDQPPTPYIPFNTRKVIDYKSDPSTFQAPLRLDFTAPLKPNGHVGVTSPSFSGLRDGHTDRWGNLEIR